MSRRRAVAHRVVSSVRRTAKSPAPVGAGPPALTPDRVPERLTKVQQERVAELVRLALVGGVAAPAARVDGVAARPVAPQLAEHLGQRALGDLADRLRRQRPLAPPPLEVAAASSVSASRRSASASSAASSPSAARSTAASMRSARPVRSASWRSCFEPVEVVELAHQPERFLERERRCRPAPGIGAPLAGHPEPVEMLAKLAERLLHPRIVEYRLLERLELLALLRREALEQ